MQQEIIYSFRVLFASRKQFSGEKLCNSENQGLVFAHVFIISPGTELPNYQKKIDKKSLIILVMLVHIAYLVRLTLSPR